jgi:hypothetical protein
MEPITTTTAIVGAGAWFGNKLLGPTIEIIGNDLKQLYENGKDKIVANAIKKTKDVELKGQTNLRVTRDVFWNGSFTDESICAEYFGGILAASRSVDGKDDSGVFYVDIIKSMSSSQLKMHYIIYRTLNKELIANEEKKALNPGQETDLGREELFFPLLGTIEQFKNEDLGAILHGLNAKNLIGNFQTGNHELEVGKTMPYLKVSPKSLGIQLFAIANNMFNDWRNFPKVDFGDFDDVILPGYYAQSLDKLLEKAGLKKTVESIPNQ